MGSEGSQMCGEAASGLHLLEPLRCSPDCFRAVTLLVAFHAGGEQMPAQAGSRGCPPDLPLCPQPKPENAITIAVSSRALFRMEEEQKIYTEQGVEAYVKYQLDHENEPFLPGAAFPFVKVSSHSALVPKNFWERTEIVWGQDGHRQQSKQGADEAPRK